MANLVKKIRTNEGDLPIDYGALANLPAINNNLLINSDFRNPVNQRGKTSYTGTGSSILYTIDRWGVINGPTLTIQQGDSLKIQNPSNSAYSARFKQVFENALPVDFYTISVKVKSNTNKVYINNLGEIQAGFTGIYSHTSIERSLSEIDIIIAPGASIEIEWIKLERGTAATPFVPRPYGEEIALCRRYYKKYEHTYFIGIGMATSDGVVLPLSQEPMYGGKPILTVLSAVTFNPTSNLTSKFVNLSSDYAVVNQQSQFVSFKLGTATPGEIGRIYGKFELDAEIY